MLIKMFSFWFMVLFLSDVDSLPSSLYAWIIYGLIIYYTILSRRVLSLLLFHTNLVGVAVARTNTALCLLQFFDRWHISMDTGTLPFQNLLLVVHQIDKQTKVTLLSKIASTVAAVPILGQGHLESPV